MLEIQIPVHFLLSYAPVACTDIHSMQNELGRYSFVTVFRKTQCLLTMLIFQSCIEIYNNINNRPILHVSLVGGRTMSRYIKSQ